MTPSDSRPRQRVLIVDDSHELTKCISLMLAHIDHTHLDCQCAYTAIDALAMHEQARAEGQPFTLLILDWEMPVTNGLEVAQAIRERGDTVKIAFLTAYFEEMVKQSVKDLGAELWAKPIEIQTLSENVRRIFAQE